MTSFLRDLWVEIPGYGNNRLNAAYAAGGMGLLDKTLQHNFGIRVDGNIEVDFTQFSRIIDLLGGVELELRQDEANLINGECGSSLRAGLQTLNGNEALSYARIRKLDADSDLSRSNRQRKVLTSLVAKFKDSDMNTMLKLLDQVLPMVTTDMKQAEIIGLATEVFPMLMKLEMVSQRIPADGAYRFATISGMSVVQADMDAARDLLEQTLMN
jgi:LCP family protein required for cell wall assembly